jgi:zinc transporter ZupT
MIPWPLQLGYVTALVVVGTVALVVALATVRLPFAMRLARLAAGGSILAILVVDLIPDTLADAREEGIDLWLVVVIGLSVFGILGAWRGYHGRRHHPHAGDGMPALLSVHGLVEGVAAGAGAGLNAVVGMPALLGLAIHKSVEGVDLALYLRTPLPAASSALATAEPRRRSFSWLTLNALAPLTGVVAAQTLPLPQVSFAVCMSVISGLLLHVVLRICLDQLAAPVRRAPWLTFSAAFAATTLFAVGASRLAG